MRSIANSICSWWLEYIEFEEGTITDWGVFLARVNAINGWKNLKNDVQIRPMRVTRVFFCSCVNTRTR